MTSAYIIGTIVFYLVTFLLGYWVANKKDSSKSAETMFVGNRKIPLFVGVFTMTATWVGGGYINGTAEASFGSGLLWTQAPWGYACSLLLGGLFFAKKMREENYVTMLDPFEKKYGAKVSGLLFIPALIGEVFWSAAILTALGYTFSTILEIPFSVAILTSAAIAISYTLLGGLWSVAATDVAQLVFIGLGLGLAVPALINAAGGWDTMWSSYQSAFGYAAKLFPDKDALKAADFSLSTWLDFGLLLVFGGIPWGVYFQRVLSARSPQAAKNLSILAAVGCILLAIPPMIIGMAAKLTDWNSLIGFTPESAMILPAVLKYLVPPVVSVLGLSAVAAAVMSSIDSSILSASSMFVWNVYRPIRGHSEKKLLLASKLTILIIGCIATALALSVRSVYDLWFFCSDLVYVILFPQLLMVIYFKQVNVKGAVAGLILGFCLRLTGGFSLLGIPSLSFWLDSSGNLAYPMRTIAMLATLLSIILVSLATRSNAGEKSKANRLATSYRG
ncbi:sodium:solute symporter family protein [Pseudobacteriovorax antillogorgiicola]|nr:sodium:solute symporter family protein [Pseudobacteriovorax antillogorgiicola]